MNIHRVGTSISSTVLLLGAVACCCTREPCCPNDTPVRADGVAMSSPAPATGTLVVSSIPAGEVWIDDQPAGSSPLETATSAGRHEVEVRLAGFEAATATVDVGPGQRTEHAVKLVVRDVEDREVLQMLARSATAVSGGKLWVQPFAEPGVSRDVAGPVAAATIYPRGSVRTEELTEFRLDFGAATMVGGELRFARGDAVLYKADLPVGQSGAYIRPVPAEVRTALATSDAVTWGWYPKEGDAVEATFTVVAPEIAGTLASIEKGLAGQPRAAVSYLRMQVLSDAGLSYGAHQEAQTLIRAGQGGVRAWAAVLDALDHMQVSKESIAWRDAQARLASFSRTQQSEAFGGGDYGDRKLLENVRLGHASRALEGLDAARSSAFAQSTASSLALADETAIAAVRSAERAPAASRKLVGAVLALAKRSREQAPEDPDARRAVASATVAAARTGAALGDAPNATAWLEAAKTLVSVYELDVSDGGRAYAQAASWLREAAAGLPNAERAKVLDAAKGIAAKARAALPDAPATAVAVAYHLLAMADAEGVREAKAHVIEAKGALAKFVAEDPIDPAVATVQLELASLDLRRALKAGIAYRLDGHLSPDDLLKFDVPAAADRWVVATELADGYLAHIEQRSADGSVIRALVIRSVPWDRNLKFASGATAGGDNPSLLAKHDLEEARRSLAKIRVQGQVQKAPFSKAFPKADAYDTRGIDHEGAQHRIRGWAIKSARHQLSFLVTIDEFRGAKDDDPELDVLVESIAEVEPAK